MDWILQTAEKMAIRETHCATQSNSATMSFGGRADSREQEQLQQLILMEQQKEIAQSAILKLTDLCWGKCVSKPASSLSSSESDCITACTERYLDTAKLVTTKLTQQR